MHLIFIESDLVDTLPFCCDSCAREYAAAHGLPYDGWNGAHESEFPVYCASLRHPGRGRPALRLLHRDREPHRAGHPAQHCNCGRGILAVTP